LCSQYSRLGVFRSGWPLVSQTEKERLLPIRDEQVAVSGLDLIAEVKVRGAGMRAPGGGRKLAGIQASQRPQAHINASERTFTCDP